jgi:hypothetical protein
MFAPSNLCAHSRESPKHIFDYMQAQQIFPSFRVQATVAAAFVGTVLHMQDTVCHFCCT